MKKTELTIPCQWDLNEIKKIISQNAEQKIKITEMYGALSDGNTPQGRSVSISHKSSKENALLVKEYLLQKGIKFAYLINTPLDLNKYQGLEEELDWIINVFKADSITVSSLDLMRFIRNKYPKMSINVSTIAGIKTVLDVQKYLQIGPNKIIAHHDLNRNFAELTKIMTYLHKHNINMEIMVNESCLRRCPYREAHYYSLGKGEDDRKYHKKCNRIKFENPYQILMSNFIRPEDLTLYEDMGISMFKITGRSKPKEWLPEVVAAYANRDYAGNLIRLLGIDPKLVAEDKIYIENKALEGFIINYPKTGIVQDEIDYCEIWIKKLFQTGEFKLANEILNQIYYDRQKLRVVINGDIYQ